MFKVDKQVPGDSVAPSAMLHRSVLESGLNETTRFKYEKAQTELQDAYIKKENFFARIDRERKGSAAKADYLIKLCGDAAFIPGTHRDIAQRLIGRHILQPDFLKLYSAPARTGKERSRKIDELKLSLLTAGIDDTFAARLS